MRAPPPPPREWERVVAKLRESRPALGAVLQHGVPTVISPARLVIAFPKGSFFGAQAQAVDAREAVAEAAARDSSVARPVVEVVQTGRPRAAGGSVRGEAVRDQERREETRPEGASRHRR